MAGAGSLTFSAAGSSFASSDNGNYIEQKSVEVEPSAASSIPQVEDDLASTIARGSK